MNSQQRDSKKIIRFKHELKMTFLFNFLCLSEEVETLGKKQVEQAQGRALRKFSGSPLGFQPFQLRCPALQVGHPKINLFLN